MCRPAGNERFSNSPGRHTVPDGGPAALLRQSDLVTGQPIFPGGRATCRRTWRLYIAAAIAISMAGGAFGQRALTWDEVRRRFEDTNPTLRAARIGIDESKAQEVTAYLRPNPDFTTTHRPDRPLHHQPVPPVCQRAAVLLGQLPARAPAQAGVAAGERAQGNGHRAVPTGGPGAEPSLQPAQRFRAGAPGQGGAGGGAGEPGVLRPPAGGEQRPVQSGRHRARGPGPAATAAGAVRNRRANRRSERADGEDPASHAAERPHADRTIRRDGAVRVQRAGRSRSKSCTRSPWPAGRT